MVSSAFEEAVCYGGLFKEVVKSGDYVVGLRWWWSYEYRILPIHSSHSAIPIPNSDSQKKKLVPFPLM